MNKILLIIQREYLSRVRKKSFIVMTFLGPLLMGGVLISSLLLNKVDSEVKVIAVKDETHAFESVLKNSERLVFRNISENIDSAKKHCLDNGYFGVLYIPPVTDPKLLESSIQFYSESQPGFDLISKIEFSIEKEVNAQKYIDAGIDEEKLSTIKTDVRIAVKNLQDEQKNVSVSTVLGFVSGLMIYLFIFIYGAMVMRGVLEEKTSRIVEVIISSVKPFQIMMGKIVGVALVGLTQLILWVVLTGIVYAGVGTFMAGKNPSSKVDIATAMNPELSRQGGADKSAQMQMETMDQINDALSQVNFPLVVGMFIFYFIGGYLLYSALFAAVGAAADAETDTQQFMLPVTIPLIIAYVASINVMSNPQGNVAFWFSIIPFTSPIVMMVRLPFGVPYGQIVLSVILLIAGFIFTTWLAGRIYRTGILMYGKKVSYRELWKWLRYHN